MGGIFTYHPQFFDMDRYKYKIDRYMSQREEGERRIAQIFPPAGELAPERMTQDMRDRNKQIRDCETRLALEQLVNLSN